MQIVAQIGAALPPFTISLAAATEELLENSAAAASFAALRAEDLAENIEGIMEPARRRAGGALRERRVAVAVISRALVGVHQDVVSLAELLELFLRMRIVRIFVGVKFYRELAIGALELVAGGSSSHLENFVIIAFGRGHR